MNKPVQGSSSIAPHAAQLTSRAIITPKTIGVISLILLSIVAAVGFLLTPEKFQPTLLFVFPAVFVGIWILVNPWVGVYLFYLYAVLRPYDIIPALLPLRLAMVIEIVTLTSFTIYTVRTKAALRWHQLNWYYLGFLGVLAVNVYLALNNFFAYNAFEDMLVTFIMFVIATNVVNSLNRLTKLIWTILLIHLYFAISGILNFEVFHTYVNNQMTSGKVGSGFIGDENDFALALVTWVPFAFFLFVTFRSAIRKGISLLLLGAFTWGIVSSQSRGGWVAIVVAMLFCIVNSKRKLLALGLTTLAVIGFLMVAPPQYYAKLKTTTQVEEGTADERIRSWKAGFAMFLDHPVTGVGGGNSGIYLPQYITGVADPARFWGRALHGTLPQVLAENGTIGFLCYAGIVVIAVRQLLRIRRTAGKSSEPVKVSYIANSLLGGILAYFVGATFISTAYYPELWLLILLTVILSHIVSNESSSVPATEDQSAAQLSVASPE
ncbi:MAG TPA: O-antigen ligase family protein [Candidatus Acidoferrum sp.]|nr:O-antigen ligase family protein [Candidatus Acidoferrum sp.]